MVGINREISSYKEEASKLLFKVSLGNPSGRVIVNIISTVYISAVEIL